MQDRSDPYFDWSSVFSPGDVIRLPDGQVGVVVHVDDCSEDSRPPHWEMYVRYQREHLGPGRHHGEPWSGMVDAGFVDCADGSVPAPDPTSRAEAQSFALFD